jgi:hypothetical protein
MSHVPYASAVGSLMYAMVCTKPNIAYAVGVLRRIYVKTREGALDNIKKGFSGICVALLDMDYDTKEYQDWTECWTYMALWMQNGLEIWIIGYLQVGMCLTFLEEQSVG